MPGRRFRKRTKSEEKASSLVDESNVSAAESESFGVAVSSTPSSPENFVTQPPKQTNKGLTGKISTLFRREATSKEPTNSSGSHNNISIIETGSPGSASAQQQQRSPHSTSDHGGGEGDLDGTTPRSGSQPHPKKKKKRQQGGADTSNNAAPQPPRSPTKRIFYSSNCDEDSDDDSYESRLSAHSRRSSRDTNNRGEGARKQQSSTSRGASSGTDFDDEYRSMGTYSEDVTVRTIKRYRGFSTSIKSLFLDEALVCAACGCFGLILSNRTEYLLQLRNERRGLLSGSARQSRKDRKRMPSRIIALGLALTLLLMFSTFIIWGFGTGNDVANDYLSGYDYYEDGEEEQWWDDYLSNNDDNANNNNNYNYNNNNNYANDDGGNNYQNAAAYDDAYAAAAYDDDAANNDDGNNYNYDDANDDAADDDAARRLDHTTTTDGMTRIHPPRGIFKLRDYQEHVWNPVFDHFQGRTLYDALVQDATKSTSGQARRRNEEDYNDNDDDAYAADSNGNDGSSETSNGGGYQKPRDIASDIRIALLFAFLLFLGILGRRRRMRTRFYLVRARAQEDHLYYASSDAAAARRVAFDDTREDQYEGACSHTLCGCYPVDEIEEPTETDENVEVTDTGIFKRKKKPHHEDIVARCFNCIMGCCCGVIFKCWFQCLSICALAQEAREVRLLIPPRYQRIDFITHQPFHEYQFAVNDLRRGWLGKARRVSGLLPHYNALSRLSRYILILSFLTIVTIVLTLVLNPRAAFSWQDVVVLVATFLQSFLVLFVVHWIFHKSDLSLDAVIKLFAAGFLIAVPTAFFFEGLLVNIVLFAAWILYDVLVWIIGEDFSTWVFEHWRAIWIVGELFNAYVVAAVTEELCKYYTFRAVEHPDLVFLTGLQREEQGESAMDGGLVKYPFASHQVQQLSRGESFDTDASERSRGSHRSSSSRKKSRKSSAESLIETGTTEAEYEEDELDARTHRQRAMAITTGMISVAVGLACAENFLYVFVLGGALGENDADGNNQGHLMEAWIVLFFRSIFPVHALSAAMQSINMIRKFVEYDDHCGHRIGVGRIIFPAVILHGTFDAILMGINVFVETAWDKYLEENDGNVGDSEPYNSILVNLIAWVSITAIMLIGMFWYYKENRNQRSRLKLLEEQEKANQAESGLETWNNPGSPNKTPRTDNAIV